MSKFEMDSSVGNGAVNESKDVLGVQQALNAIADKIGLESPLAEDGAITGDGESSPTCHAIGLFQTKILDFEILIIASMRAVRVFVRSIKPVQVRADRKRICFYR
ncbi:hypothetical protein [Vibrio mexicanus]|uniref:hypothetical protein n=1 Tax=Vibrio mexicanus TaxID=1004326 RepID=UPI00063C9C08|nr:hypothetical protein [Vibrio mexicanus]